MVLGVLALAVPVQAAGGVKYKGKTSSAHPITFVLKGKKLPAFHYNEVTTKHTLSSKLNRRTGAITGTQRIQYSFLIPKYPIGTFVIYSCLGSGEFKATPLKRGG